MLACPEFASWTASIESIRIVLMHCSSTTSHPRVVSYSSEIRFLRPLRLCAREEIACRRTMLLAPCEDVVDDFTPPLRELRTR
jgi:hypothetical protein